MPTRPRGRLIWLGCWPLGAGFWWGDTRGFEARAQVGGATGTIKALRVVICEPHD